MIYSAVAALLVFGSCSTAYQTAQTPDDVYHSPVRDQRVYASGNQRAERARAQEAEETFDEEEGEYVTYADEDEDRYDYARRIDRFSRPYTGSYWDGYYFDDFGSNMYINNYYGYNSWNRFGWNSWYGPSLSIGFGFGRPWGGYYNSWYNPWYNNWYGGGWGHGWYGGSGWYGGGHGWYGGGYPWYGGHGGYYVKPRPADSYRPRGSSNSRVYYDGNNSRPSGTRRVYDSNNGRPFNPNTSGTRRTYDSDNSRPAPQPGNRRTFERAPSERPASQPAPAPQRQRYERNYDRSNSAPPRQQSQPSYTPERSAPQRSYSPPSNPGSSSPAPTRSYRPRGR